jgi:hypothetical protein
VGGIPQADPAASLWTAEAGGMGVWCATINRHLRLLWRLFKSKAAVALPCLVLPRLGEAPPPSRPRRCPTSGEHLNSRLMRSAPIAALKTPRTSSPT